MKDNKIFLALLAILVPPFSVYLKRGMGPDVRNNALLWLLLWVPGTLHAWYLIATD